MKLLFDTSVLVAAIWTGHPQHLEAKAWLLRARRGEIEVALSQHTLLEAYASLTAMPSRPKLAPAEVRAAVTEAISGLDIVSLGPSDYLGILETADRQGLVGGIVYDLLIAASAVKFQADTVVTANAKDFSRLLPKEGPSITPLQGSRFGSGE